MAAAFHLIKLQQIGAGNLWEVAGGLNTFSMMESQLHTVTFFCQ